MIINLGFASVDNHFLRVSIINRGEAEVDNHYRRVNILTITLSGMYYLFYHTEKTECICRRRTSQSKSTSFWHNRNDVASFWCNVMMSYLTFMITECQTAQAAQIWFQMFFLTSLRKHVLKYAFNSAIIEIKRLTETHCTRINAAHVIVEIIAE